jgi:hypothetical protein
MGKFVRSMLMPAEKNSNKFIIEKRREKGEGIAGQAAAFTHKEMVCPCKILVYIQFSIVPLPSIVKTPFF